MFVVNGKPLLLVVDLVLIIILFCLIKFLSAELVGY